MEDRRMLIADSAIEVVARDGVRALTHRAVDSEAGLPSGSTSYYCRTRAQLLALTVDRLTSLLRGFVEVSGIQELASSDADDVLAMLTRMIEGLLADYRGELAARSALIMELTGKDDTTDLVAALLDPSDLAGALDAAGLRDPAAAALDLLAVYEGLLWERTVGRLAGAEVDHEHDTDLLGSALSRHEHRGGRLFGLLR
ncbi:TetR/AcrR family transcriptional regulator [Dietzia cercidiphylli]|uniref:Tetracyclin repressor-like C-terminal group 31 domain-containing protein n=2 Tax=Dietzia cercidiphylli TaxID=498199 RepID=A0ABP4V6S2_9ACTN|nr:transcriptional regulator [Dietzia cercidiphylli]MBB1046907.1 transcriptional regulator [Dietzia cercidiphylli]